MKNAKFRRTQKLNKSSVNFESRYCFDTLKITAVLAKCHSKIHTNFQAAFRNFGRSVSNFQRAIRFFNRTVLTSRPVLFPRTGIHVESSLDKIAITGCKNSEQSAFDFKIACKYHKFIVLLHVV